MTDQQRKNRKTIILLFAMTGIPFLIAWYLSANTAWMSAGTNRGELMVPPITTVKSDLQAFDEFTRQNIDEFKGRWVIFNVIDSSDCEQDCRLSIHKTKQIRLMMNKDLTRIRRGALLLVDADGEKAKTWWEDDSRLLRVKATPVLVKKIKNTAITHGMLIIMDPLGNMMMRYQTDFDPYDVKADLMKLLRISQIG